MKKHKTAPKTCPHCSSEIRTKGKLTIMNSWETIPRMTSTTYKCDTSFLPDTECFVEGPGCPAYVSAYPLPPHLAKIHRSEKRQQKVN